MDSEAKLIEQLRHQIRLKERALDAKQSELDALTYETNRKFTKIRNLIRSVPSGRLAEQIAAVLGKES